MKGILHRAAQWPRTLLGFGKPGSRVAVLLQGSLEDQIWQLSLAVQQPRLDQVISTQFFTSKKGDLIGLVGDLNNRDWKVFWRCLPNTRKHQSPLLQWGAGRISLICTNQPCGGIRSLHSLLSSKRRCGQFSRQSMLSNFSIISKTKKATPLCFSK